MSLVKDRFYVDPVTLDSERAAVRSRVLAEMLRSVAAGVSGEVGSALVLDVRSGMPPDEVLRRSCERADFVASQLPGKWTILNEGWQGGSFVARGAYSHEEVVVLVSGDGDSSSDIEVDTMWFDVTTLRALGTLLPEDPPAWEKIDNGPDVGSKCYACHETVRVFWLHRAKHGIRCERCEREAVSCACGTRERESCPIHGKAPDTDLTDEERS